ncbi:hypothetical protein NY2A_b875R [Paramecium bursaria Chlorella virus NY2A]|uniref:Uncharacterized protein b875R n=1 Tax=Paramecium bursaria Chlorella virus NY2A TaxID=46021 RepID=A7IY50_PBCVN|nr:hypothetical protein NY2A_b875R [Paramecium bursaria Chlorella virus NY2A]ABT15274.1 hypothetical protein NY2A_b875R [Paramecium bursaria Chlorella virus NY2A]
MFVFSSKHQRCVSICIHDVDVRTGFDEKLYTCIMPIHGSIMYSCPITYIGHINICICFDEKPQNCIISGPGREMYRHPFSIIDDIKSCTCFYECLRTCMAIKHCSMEGCASRNIDDIKVCTCIDKSFDTLFVSILSSIMQCSPSTIIGHVNTCSSLD